MTMIVKNLGGGGFGAVPRFDISRVPLATAVPRLNFAVQSLHSHIRTRVRTSAGTPPASVRLDGKDWCSGGRWGLNINYESKTYSGDPVHCRQSRDLVQPAIVRVSVPCEDPGQLLWPDVFVQAQRDLRYALRAKPRPGDDWQLQAAWTRRVMALVSMAYEATNIQPIFMYPALWATKHPRILMEGDYPDNPRDIALRPWGEYTAALTYDNRHTCLDRNRADTRIVGSGVPRSVHLFITNMARRKLGVPSSTMTPGRQANCGSFSSSNWIPWAGWQVGGLKFWRQGSRPDDRPSALTPSMYNGPWISSNSPTMKAMTGVNFDPWSTQGWGGNWNDCGMGAGCAYPDGIPRVWTSRRSAVPIAERAERLAKGYNQQSLSRFMEQVFRETYADTEHLIPYIPSVHSWGRAQNESGLVDWGPSARYYVDLAATWATEIINLNYYRFIADATLFYLRNHSVYYKRRYGDTALSISAEDLSAMADAVQASKAQMMLMPMTMSAQVLSMINPIAGAVAGIVGDIAKGFVEFASEFWTQEDLPKSLFRRLPINQACEWSTADDIGRAALVIAESSRGTGGASDDPPQAGAGPNPLLIVGGAAAVGIAAWLYFKDR